MRMYTVHELSGAPADGKGFVFVREGFCWPALVFTLFWLLSRRLWVAASLWFALTVLLGFGAEQADVSEELMTAVFFLLQGAVAVVGHDIERWTLSLKGYREIGVASGSDLTEAERDFFRHWTAPVTATPPAKTKSLTAPVSPHREDPDAHTPLGLFPHAGA